MAKKTKPEDIFDALRDPETNNLDLADGTLAGEKVTFVVACEDDEDEGKIIALLVDDKTRELLDWALDDVDVDEDEEDEEEEDERPKKGKRFIP